MTINSFQSRFFQNVVTILLSQISFSAQFPERSSTSVSRLERAQDILYVIAIKHQKLGICNRNHNYFVQRLFSVSAVVSFFYINMLHKKIHQIQEFLHSNTYLQKHCIMLKVLKPHSVASFNGKSMKSYFHLTQPGSKSEECLNVEAFSLTADSVPHLSTLFKHI